MTARWRCIVILQLRLLATVVEHLWLGFCIAEHQLHPAELSCFCVPCAFQAVLIPVSEDGAALGTPLTLGPFTTPPPTTPPTPSSAMAIAPAIGPDRFTIQNMQQDKPGYIHVVVTQPFNQAFKVQQGHMASRLACLVLCNCCIVLVALACTNTLFHWHAQTHSSTHESGSCTLKSISLSGDMPHCLHCR